MTDTPYNTQTPSHDRGGPKEVQACIECAALVTDLRIQLQAFATRVQSLERHRDALADRAAAYSMRCLDLAMLLDEHGIEYSHIESVAQRIRQKIATQSVEGSSARLQSQD